MWTGQFAKRHNISQSTIGFYIKQGLLAPAIVNGRYDFRESDDLDMQLIAELKRLQFNLEDISVAVTQFRIFKDSVAPADQRLLSMFIYKRMELLEEQARLQSSLTFLEQTICMMQERENAREAKTQVNGLDIRFLPLLNCPCGKRLTMNLEQIESGQIRNASLSCTCGYNAVIENGILINPKGECLPTPPVYTYFHPDEEMTGEMRNYLYHLYRQMESMLSDSSCNGKVILETHIGNSSFLLQKAKVLSPSSLYIFCDPQYEVIAREKKLLDALDRQLNTMCIVSNYQVFPLERGCVDFIIDYFQNTSFDLFTDGFVFPRWKRYLHQGSKLIGVFIDIPHNSRSAVKFKAIHPDCTPNMHSFEDFKHSLKEHGFVIEQLYQPDPLSRSYHPWHYPGDKLHYYCYCARLEKP